MRALPAVRSVTPPQAVLDLMAALHDGDWEFAEASTSSHRSQASGLVAAHLQWHLERKLRTLPLVERVYGLMARPLSAVRMGSGRIWPMALNREGKRPRPRTHSSSGA